MLLRMQMTAKKRGFTMVELIAVIAIIGTLAAILIPVISYTVVTARVTSTNADAKNIATSVRTFMLTADGFGIIEDETNIVSFDITVSGNTWSCTGATNPSCFYNGKGVTWGSAASYTEGEDISSSVSGEKRMLAALFNDVGGMDKASMHIVLKGQRVSFVALCRSTDVTLDSDDYPPITNGDPAPAFEWDGVTSGVSAGGMVIGTYPQIKRA